MKKWALLLLLLATFSFAWSQEEGEQKGFKKENLFSGGTVSLSFFNNTFLIGANPVLGYRLANWVDAGIVVNFQWVSFRDVSPPLESIKQTTYGAGVFTRLFPIEFLFAQVQLEHNFINQKYIPVPNSGFSKETLKTSANSVLIGGGYTSGRNKYSNSPFFYMSILFDISGNKNSPYVDSKGRVVPIIMGGFNIPLFQNR
jgi:hypothetical protein